MVTTGNVLIFLGIALACFGAGAGLSIWSIGRAGPAQARTVRVTDVGVLLMVLGVAILFMIVLFYLMQAVRQL